MLRKIAARTVFVLACLLAMIPAAHAQGRLDGQIFGLDGKPLADATIQLKSSDSGQTYTIKTGKDGKYVQIGMTQGIYDMTIVVKAASIFTQKIQIKNGEANTQNLNLKDLAAAQAAAHPEEEKKKADEEDKFKDLKIQFEAGRAAIADAEALRKQITSAAADQKAALQSKLDSDVQIAVTSFQKAEQDVGEKDVNNHSTILAYLGQSDQLAGKYSDSIDAYQKSLALKPTATVYNQLSLSEVNAAAAETDPKAMQDKLTEAGADCDKASALDPTLTAMCWKNIGVVLTNTKHMPEAVPSLQKASQADPKDAQTWFLLGGALTATMSYKQEGDKFIMIIAPGTAEAYQKCIDTAPNGPYAPQCKGALDGLAQMNGGVETQAGKKKKKD